MLYIINAVQPSHGAIVVGQAGSALGTTGGGKLGKNAGSHAVREGGTHDVVPFCGDQDGEHSGASSRG